MINKKFFIFLGISVAFLTTSIILFFVIGPVVTQKDNTSLELKKYGALYDLELVEKEEDKYYIIYGLDKDYPYGPDQNGTLIFPETIDDIPVKKIISKEKAFSDYRHLTKIVISKNITYIGTSDTDSSIGDKIFKEATNLKIIEVAEENPVYKSSNGILYNKDLSILLRMPNNYVLGEDFNFNIPNTVNEIYQESFINNDLLSSVNIPTNVKVIGNNAFSNCDNLVTVNFTEDSKLERIGIEAFYKCSTLTSFNVPTGVTTIENMAFSNCAKLGSLFIPNTVVNFGIYIVRISPNVVIYTTKDNVVNLQSKYENFGIEESEAQNIIRETMEQ